MKILLLSHNHTVQEMVALALRDRPDLELITVPAVDAVPEHAYDLMIVDDALPEYPESIALAEVLSIPQTVLLYHGPDRQEMPFDRGLRKPFIPAEVRDLVDAEQQYLVSKNSEEASPVVPDIAPKKKKKNKAKKKKKLSPYHAETEVLNLDEIETIKALLEEEGMEIVPEENLAESMIDEAAQQSDRQKELIDALRTMRPKDIRKLLKGATVRIEIVFPEVL